MEMSPGKFHYRAQQYIHQVKPEDSMDRHLKGRERRRLRMSNCQDGMVIIDGLLAEADASLVQQALKPLARKAGKNDHRTAEQRMADALVEFTLGHARVEVLVTCSEETILGEIGCEGAHMDYCRDVVPAPFAQTLAARASLRGILFDGKGVVINVGRARRVETPAMRKARNARDNGCVVPGCHRPARFTAGHHLKWFKDGGGTDLCQLPSVCWHCHGKLNYQGWTLSRAPEGDWIFAPPTTSYRKWDQELMSNVWVEAPNMSSLLVN